MQLFFPDVPPIPLPDGHRFPVGKYAMLRRAIEADPIFRGVALVPAEPATRAELELAHAPSYVDSMTEGTVAAGAMRRIGLPWSPTLVARSKATVGGAIQAARMALQIGVSGQLAGGTHHAHRDFGSGFCVFNDLAIAALAMLEEGRVARVAIVDLDVHQGDGNAAILAADPRVFVLSIHGEKNFPFRKVPSTLDVALRDGTEDAAYLVALIEALAAVEAFRPDLIFYLSGADPLASDRLGRLRLTHDGLIERDRLVMELARRRGIPLSIAIGGGYAEPLEESVRAYHNTFRTALEVLGPLAA
jgi:acetoin utilization deacetylase AcuC-like enzyme